MKWLLAVAFAGSCWMQSLPAYVRLDAPIESTVPQNFIISGGVIASDAVHVWAWPDSGPVFLGAADTVHPDPLLNSPRGGFSLAVTNAPLGSYWVVAYAHNPNTGDFSAQSLRWMTVRPCIWQAEDWPYSGPFAQLFFWYFLVCR